MRIGIDARELCGQATGAGRYLGGLLHEWGAADEAAQRHEFILYAPEPLGVFRRPAAVCDPSGAGQARHVVGTGASSEPRAAADHLDVFFAPAYSAPLRLRGADGRGHPRRLVLRASGVVSAARRSPAPLADAPVGGASASGRDDLRLLAAGDSSTRSACPTPASTSFHLA